MDKRERFFGIDVIVSPHLDTPRMQLSEKVPVTPEFRKEINEWMIDFFGMDHKIFQAYDINGKLVYYMGIQSYEKLKRGSINVV